MTENTKVSAIAFTVLILGMLGFFVALTADILFSPGAPAVVTPPTPTLPREAQDGVMLGRALMTDAIRQSFHFDVTGDGQVLPEERAQQVEEVICYHLSSMQAQRLPGRDPDELAKRAEWSIGDRIEPPCKRALPVAAESKSIIFLRISVHFVWFCG